MSGKSLIKEFESELVVIGFSDDSLAGIVANILADISTLWFVWIYGGFLMFLFFNDGKDIESK